MLARDFLGDGAEGFKTRALEHEFPFAKDLNRGCSAFPFTGDHRPRFQLDSGRSLRGRPSRSILQGFGEGMTNCSGAKERTKADLENERAGKDTGIERTKRLIYVTCSRAEESLALVAYTENPQTVRAQLLRDGWFDESEMVDIN